ncbi:hypothetical protein SPURM210S_00888 [Streptomyces purpurascens]
MAKRIQQLCQYLVEHYDGDAEAVWKDVGTGKELLKRLAGLPGFGKQKAQIFLALLGKQLGVRPDGCGEAAGSYGEPQSFRCRRHHRPRVAGQGTGAQAGDQGGGQGREGRRRVTAGKQASASWPVPGGGPLRPGPSMDHA